MAFTSGTATDYHDLLDKLRLWLVSIGWTQLAWTAPGSLTAEAKLQMRAPGAGVDKQVFVNIRSQNDGAQKYSWQITGALSYTVGLAWGNQNSESPLKTFMNLWTGSTPYWFFGNDRRVIVVAKTSTNYTSMHAGFFLPWATPAQYPFPFYISADYASSVAWNTVDSARRFCVDPGGTNDSEASAWVRSPDGVWVPARNHSVSGNTDSLDGQVNRLDTSVFVWPYCTANTETSLGGVSTWGTYTQAAGGGSFDNMVPTAQGERWILPVHLCRAKMQPLGALDGVYCPLGTGLSTEQVVTASGKSLRAFQNINRNSANDFMLVEEV